MRFLIAFGLFLIALTAGAQSLQGVVIDSKTGKPVPYATVSANNKGTLSSATGSFSLSNIIPGDTIVVSFIGYKSYKQGITTIAKRLTVYLEPDSILLNKVTIRSSRNYKADSLLNRKWYDTVFNYKPMGIKDVVITRSPYARSDRPNNTSELVSVNVLQVLSLLSKKNNDPMLRLQKRLIADEAENNVDLVFTKGRITALTGLKGDSLSKFMVRYRPSVSEVKNMTGYDIWVYIKKSYREFVNAGTVKGDGKQH